VRPLPLAPAPRLILTARTARSQSQPRQQRELSIHRNPPIPVTTMPEMVANSTQNRKRQTSILPRRNE